MGTPLPYSNNGLNHCNFHAAANDLLMSSPSTTGPSDHAQTLVLRVLERATACLKLPFSVSGLNLADLAIGLDDHNLMPLLQKCSSHAGLSIREVSLDSRDARDVLTEGMIVLVATKEESIWIIESLSGSDIEATKVSESAQPQTLSKKEFNKLFEKEPQSFVITRELACSSISDNRDPQYGPGLTHDSRDVGHGHGHGDAHHRSPLSRFLGILRLDSRDIWTVIVFALVNGILGLASPLAVESLVNVVSWGTYLQPLLVLGFILLSCLALAAFLTVLQTSVVEIIQRRQFVRIVSDLAHRFPRAHQADLQEVYPREYANRVFDIMTIQKSMASLLIDGISIALVTIIGMTLLAFYHPFLLGFDLVLLISMVSVTWLLGRGGVTTAIDESLTKYHVAHWLQDVLSSPTTFKINGGRSLAVERANQLTTEYVLARQRQFRVTIRQFAFAVGLQAVASTAILGLGGWLVIQQQLTLGQLVASELVVTVVVGAFSKAGKLLEKYYDLMAAIDKVGHLLDISVDPRLPIAPSLDSPAEIRWGDIELSMPHSSVACTCSAGQIAPGARVAIVGENSAGKSLMARAISGLEDATHGKIEINGLQASHVALSDQGVVGYAGDHEVLHATISINVSLGRFNIGQSHVREALERVGLSDSVATLRSHAETWLQSDGKPMSRPELSQLMLARAIVGKPRLLIVDGALDLLPQATRDRVWKYLIAADQPWTLVVVSNDPKIIDQCSQRVEVVH